jgi:hypothetical protein
VRKLVIALAGMTALVAILYYSGFVESFIYGFEGHAGLPSCDSSHGQKDAKNAMENSPMMMTLHLSIVDISQIKTISANTEKVECQATIILNSAQQGLLNYSFNHGAGMPTGKYFVRSALDLESFKPYP